MPRVKSVPYTWLYPAPRRNGTNVGREPQRVPVRPPNLPREATQPQAEISESDGKPAAGRERGHVKCKGVDPKHSGQRGRRDKLAFRFLKTSAFRGPVAR